MPPSTSRPGVMKPGTPPPRRRAAGRRVSRQHGFTLIEVIVAFALLALALTLLLGTLSGAARQIRRADEGSRAALHAQSLLAQAGAGEPLRPGHEQGELEDGHFRWSLDVAPYADPASAPTAPQAVGAPRLLELRLTVAWGEAASQRLYWRSLRLTPVQGTPVQNPPGAGR